MKIILFVLKHGLTISGILIGSLAGFVYWYKIGCASGTCMITSNPFNSSVYGAVMGGLLFNTFKKS